MKTEEMVFAHLVRGVGKRNDSDDEDIQSGDALIEDDDITPTSDSRPTLAHPIVAEGGEPDMGGRITADHSGRLDTLKTAEINVERDRRDTLTSPISALIAESMTEIAEQRPARDPAAPQQEGRDLTRRLGDSDKQTAAREASARHAADVAAHDPNAQHRVRAARLIDQARALMESGALLGAVVAAEHAFDEAERAVAPGITEVIEPARPLLAKVFSTYVGPLEEVPVLGRRIETLPPHLLDERRRSVIALVDGQRSLAQILDAARLHATDGLRVLALLMRENIIRVV
ncbi:MAG TPA: hypothetical protein VHJ20_08490 [Polyangia bacterium]|nr:hypothetical protein [Polyangia bacterium]